jgi:mono/diheme cytochrome c family protein
MKRIALASIFIAVSWCLAWPGLAQQKLNPTQAVGQKIYGQHCGVCHTKPTILSPYYGPALSREIVNNNEDALKDFIENGSDRMPGFRYALQPQQVDAVIQYLKTVTPPADANVPAKPAPRGNEREVD